MSALRAQDVSASRARRLGALGGCDAAGRAACAGQAGASGGDIYGQKKSGLWESMRVV